MWPMNLPAAEVLKLPGAGPAIPWAVFDPALYRVRYPEVLDVLADPTDQALLRFYLDRGQGLGHSPNPWFDERHYRRRYPDVIPTMATTPLASGFDNYCRGSNLVRRPHWLFDEIYYRTRYADLNEAALQQNGVVNGYSHFLSDGDREGRIGHPLFDPAVYVANFPAGEAGEIRAGGPFQHYLRRIEQRLAEVRVSPYFDPDWYLDRYPAVATAIAAGEWHCALEHYLCNDTPTAFDPLPEFSEAFYLDQDRHLVAAVTQRHFHNGYDHYLRNGARETRSPSPAIDLRWYAEQEPARTALARRECPDAFTHYLTIGARSGLPVRPPAAAAPPPAPPPDPPSAPEAAVAPPAPAPAPPPARLALIGRNRLNFVHEDAPEISVVLLVHDAFAAVMATLASLRDNFAGRIDLIVIDRGSTDECQYIDRYVAGAQRIRFETPVSIPAARNAALQYARAPVVLFLDHDVGLAHGAVAAILRRLGSHPGIGAVCGMIIGPSGLVASAGGIIWRDGSTQDHAAGLPPDAPEANFARDASFGRSVFLAADVARITAAGGFEEALGTGAASDADLGLRLAASGARTVYDPAAVATVSDLAVLATTGAAGGDAATAALAQRHGEALARLPARDDRALALALARMADSGQRRVLLIEDMVPLRTLGSGFVRTNDLIRAMARLGFAVTVFGLKPCPAPVSHIYADLPGTVEVMHDRTLDQLAAFLAERVGYYDAIWAARAHNLDSVIAMLGTLMSGSPSKPRLILDTEAVAALRLQARRAVEGQRFDVETALLAEFANASHCDRIVAVSDHEATVLRRTGFSEVTVIGHVRALTPTPRPFPRRTGMLFVGAIHEEASPNYDSLCWFADHVLPLVEAALGWETRLTVAGYVAPDVRMDRFREHPRITLRGAVPSLQPLYDAHRVFVAPTRFAAGAPYKVYEAASYGLPVVATSVLVEQLGWQDGTEILGASPTDPAGLAAHIVDLHRQQERWAAIRDAALARLARENQPDSYERPLIEVLGPARRRPFA